jgi:tetratricopeptide (TPR) repeat protein
VNSPTSRFYARSVETLLAWAAGDFAAALVLAETSEAISREGVTIELGRQSSHVWPRWLRAELLFEAQRYDEAAKWYETMHHMDPSPGPAEAIYAAPAHRRLAEIAEIQGDPDEAIRQYEMFLRYWYDVDPELQPVVDEAKTRLGVLLAARAAGGDVS